MRVVSLVVSLVLLAACSRTDGQPPSPPTAASPVATKPPAAVTVAGWIEAEPARPLGETLAAEAAAAVQAGKKPHAYLHADWCGPCVQIAKTRDDPKMQAAFAGTHIIGIDVDVIDGKQLAAAGLDGSTLPIFYRLGADGRPTGTTIDGGAWGDNIPDNMAPPLAAFFAR